MNPITLTLAHARAILLDLVRSPGFIVPTVVFPAMFFVLFGMPNAKTAEIANYGTLSYMVFGIVGICFYQFGVGIAQDRGRPWERYQRTLPVSAAQRFAARILCAIALAAMAAGLVAIVARAFTPIDLSAAQWAAVAGLALVAGIPFVLFGIALGYAVNARAAVPIATALNLLLAYAGGLWIPPQFLPHAVQSISPYLPTRQFADLLWGVVDGNGTVNALAGLAIYAAVFAAAASLGYRRDERVRYA
jgi:ABC-2 type transport system permease protein